MRQLPSARLTASVLATGAKNNPQITQDKQVWLCGLSPVSKGAVMPQAQNDKSINCRTDLSACLLHFAQGECLDDSAVHASYLPN